MVHQLRHMLGTSWYTLSGSAVWVLHLSHDYTAPPQIIERCQFVFQTWDDEFDKFTGQLREMSKKKREESIKFSWRANNAHKKLQERVTKMKE